jgi:molecular chaperone HscB
LDFKQNHFELFGLPARFALDSGQLERAYREIQTQIHPDRFAAAGEAEQRLAMQWTTRVNEAYQTLRRPTERARYLLQLNGIEPFDPGNTHMPPAFLIQQMDWRENLEQARAGRDPEALQVLVDTMHGEATVLQRQLAAQLDQQHDYAAAAATLRKLRFLDKFSEEVDQAFEDV